MILIYDCLYVFLEENKRKIDILTSQGSRAWHLLRGFPRLAPAARLASGYDWFITFIACVVIGQTCYTRPKFSFGFITLTLIAAL